MGGSHTSIVRQTKQNAATTGVSLVVLGLPWSALVCLSLLWSALVYIDLPWSAWAVSDHHRKA